MKIAIIGAYPPPTGGNSVHIKRLYEALRSRSSKCSVVDLYGEPTAEIKDSNIYRFGSSNLISFFKCAWFLYKNNSDVVHFHASALERFVYASLFFIFLIRSKTKIILTIHSGQFSDTYASFSKIKKSFTHFLLRRLSHIITVNKKQKNLLESLHISPEKISVIPAYIPPVPAYFSEADTILNRAKNRILIISSGYGESLYGYHRILEAIKSNPTLNRKVSLLLCLYNRFDAAYLEQINNSIKDIESAHIVRDLSAEQFAYLLSKSHTYVRATDLDGDAVAIREAAHFGLSVIATDIGERPEYCHLFGLDDIEALSNRLLLCCSKPKGVEDSRSLETTVDRIFHIYSDNKN